MILHNIVPFCGFWTYFVVRSLSFGSKMAKQLRCFCMGSFVILSCPSNHLPVSVQIKKNKRNIFVYIFPFIAALSKVDCSWSNKLHGQQIQCRPYFFNGLHRKIEIMLGKSLKIHQANNLNKCLFEEPRQLSRQY